jgi:hypothetical protein
LGVTQKEAKKLHPFLAVGVPTWPALAWTQKRKNRHCEATPWQST